MRNNSFHDIAHSFFSTRIFIASLFSFIFLLLMGCNDRVPLNTEKLEDYLPLQKGKYITYRVDSTVFTQYGRQTEIHSYLVKCQIDSSFLDNVGRTSFKVLRLLRDTLATTPWKNAGSFYISPGSSQLEWVEDNLRQVKLKLPISTQNSWKGNLYLTTNPLNPPYDFSNDDNIQDWDYTYTGPAGNFQFRDQRYSEVITVSQIDKSFNVPITLPNSYAFKNFAVDKFAKGIGLIYKEWECWEYQPNTGGSGGPYKIGFGIRQWMVDHN
ncbi:MAG: hypothetical protein EB025_01190 [Chitinophagaceae bacterium]|nr:hypothetical protein [Chitinophagaceae bacterium]